MEPKDFSTINLTQKEIKDIQQFCNLNKIEDIPTFLHTCAWKGYEVEKFGILGKMGGIQEKWVEKEVILEKWVEIPVEVIKEVVKVEYVEVPVEVIKEVIKEVPVEKIVTIYDNSSENELLLKIQQLEQEFSTKTTEIGIIRQEFSTITTENENIFHYKMSKKDEELDELRRTLDEHLAKPPVEVVVEKETTDNLSKSKLDALQNTLAKVRQETLEKDKKIKELEQTIQEIQKFQENKQAVYLKGSNLDDKLYK
jgi:hypothetical protein